MATTMASRTRSTAMSKMSGSAAAVSTVNLPLPQPTSTRSSFASGISSRQWPRWDWGSWIQNALQASILGSRFFFLRILMVLSSHVFKFPIIISKAAAGVKDFILLFSMGDLIFCFSFFHQGKATHSKVLRFS